MSVPKLILTCLSLLVASTFISVAQNQQQIDSVEHVLNNHTEKDTVKVDLYNELGFLYRKGDLSIAQTYLDSAISLAKTLEYKAGLSGAYNRYGILYKYKMQPDKAVAFYKKSIAIANELNNKGLVADVTNNIGNIYMINGQPIKATEAFLEALKIREEINDISGAAAAHSNLAYLYADQKNYQLATENNSKAIELYIQVNDSFELARAFGFRVYIYYFQDIYDSAIHYSDKAIDIFGRLGDQYETSTLLNNTGNILTENGRATQSLAYHEKALAIQKSLNDTIGIYTSYLSIAQSFLYIKNFTQAENYALKAITILEQTNGGTIKMYMDGYEQLAQIYNKSKSYKKAYNAFEKYNSLKDSLIDNNKNRAITEMQEKYESDKKDLLLDKKQLEIENAHIEIRERKIITVSLVALLILIFVSSYLLYNRLKLKKQQELNEEIIRQQSIKSKAIIDAEEKERTRIAKDLHDGVGQQLSAAKMIASSLDQNSSKEEYNEKLIVLRNTLDESIKEVRTVSHNMMPNALFKLGLSAAIREFLNKINATGILNVDLQIVGLESTLNKTTEIILYRVLQELVNNIIKHANASKLSIQVIEYVGDNLNITVEDDGKGFDVTNIDNFAGIGIKNISSRIEYLNGSIHFDSYQNKGTTVIIDIPLNKDTQTTK